MNYDDLMKMIKTSPGHDELGIKLDSDDLILDPSVHHSACENAVFWLITVDGVLGAPTEVYWNALMAEFRLSWASEDVFADCEKFLKATDHIPGRPATIYRDRKSVHFFIGAY